MNNPTKYIFVTGGVTSSLGKGILSASLAKLLQARGYSVTIQKLDPYINVDPGTMNPYEHGECYVTDDGAETDLDLGHYERFLSISTSQANNITTGKIYQSVIEKERIGNYLGKTVQVIPHITDEIKSRILLLAKTGNYQIIITEIGGTVGDIESLPYIEAVRQMKWKMGKNCLVIHLTLIPFLSTTGELKTKPTQHSVKTLQEYGLQPDILVCRTEHKLNKEIKSKIALFCNVETESVIEAIDADTIYEVPLLMEKEKLDVVALNKLQLPVPSTIALYNWKFFLHRLKHPEYEVRVGLVGKYVELKDSYKSIAESLIHGGAANNCRVNVKWIHSENINKENVAEKLAGLSGIIVAPGFGKRGIEGKIATIQYARENEVPFLGICLGMQCAVIEFARNVLKMQDAHSTEINPDTSHPVIDLLEIQKGITKKGGTMRLGVYPCKLKKSTKVFSIYNAPPGLPPDSDEGMRVQSSISQLADGLLISERHRHRYEFNNEYLGAFEKAGMIASGINPESELVEIVELKEHPFFIGVQFHPEYKSTVAKPHPLFAGFVNAAVEISSLKNKSHNLSL